MAKPLGRFVKSIAVPASSSGPAVSVQSGASCPARTVGTPAYSISCSSRTLRALRRHSWACGTPQ